MPLLRTPATPRLPGAIRTPPRALTRIPLHASCVTRLRKQDTFYPTLEGAGNTLVVVDFYTDWHAPL
jgi:hypothetical protein